MDKLQNNKNYSIQMLRALAAIAVFLCHVPCVKSNGQYGVIIFLVLSSFLTALYFKDDNRHYLLKKAIKLLPVYYFLTMAVFILALVRPSLLHSTSTSYISLIKSFLFIPYAYVGGETPTYTVLNVGWYMNAQVWFYVIYFVCSRINKKYKNQLCMGICIVLFVLCKTVFRANQVAKQYACTALACAGGIVLYYLIKAINAQERKFENKAIKYFLMCASFLMGYFAFRLSKYDLLKVFIAMVIVWIFFAVNVEKKNILTFVGDVSYELYLSHYFVIMAVNRILFDISAKTAVNYIITFCLLVVSVFVGFVLHTANLRLQNYLNKKLLARRA